MKSEGGTRQSEGSVLVCFPLKEEAAPFRKIAAGKPGVIVLLSGIGRQNAERAVRELLAGGASTPTGRLVGNLDSPKLVLTCGFAGGLNPDLKLGDVIFEMANAPLAPSLSPRGGERVSVRTGEGFPENAGRLNTEDKSEPTHVGCYDLKKALLNAGAKPAKFFCADHIATTAAEKKKLRDETGADAVEMESAAFHAVCMEYGILCATVRVISDPASEDLPLDFNALARPDKSLDCGKLFMAIAKSPWKIGALMKLQKQTRFAAGQLAEVLTRIL